jgi:FKBP-type peptidyl-prolyl cis-trans isomerase 2
MSTMLKIYRWKCIWYCEGREPLQFELGAGQLIAGFEAAVLGKEIGDKVTANINAEDAYGAVKEELIVKVPLDKMPVVLKLDKLRSWWWWWTNSTSNGGWD